ncbi:helix-turn-helix transcriptional regulator [Planctomicrobium piriforme]|uniref:Predicted DNA-binding transcriptional regulator YafY, contains an HTH and WYL domains n=1 Tax=Planctomicrobium piriforme TaxID=1576369 RepID=A0A1I3JAH8_9PLAN|nr:WYL domain-containing protein [Planctomicrobium piriforme]SFI57223.1 Predicted DNA-binding transcriptional regulator YafY, contains an HTH and WYL domains [Planctomicrobium piriforme]
MSAIRKIRRLLTLLERLQSGRAYSTSELTHLCGVSRRTVFRDLKTLQDAGVQILYDAATQGYWLPIHTALPPAQLTLSETLSLLVLAQEAGGSRRAVPFQEAARDAALKLQSTLPSHLTHYVNDLTSSLKIQSEPLADHRHGREHYDRLIEGITSRRKVRLHYDSVAEQTQIQTLVSPYRLLFRRHAWYAIGRSSLHRSVRTFHIGRILESEVTDDPFQVPPRFSLKRYFGHAWSLIREPDARCEVTVRFQPMVARNVAEVCWHPTQKTLWNDDGTLDFTVTVDGIQEMSWWILSYGNQALVLKPEPLRKLIAERAREMAAQY